MQYTQLICRGPRLTKRAIKAHSVFVAAGRKCKARRDRLMNQQIFQERPA